MDSVNWKVMGEKLIVIDNIIVNFFNKTHCLIFFKLDLKYIQEYRTQIGILKVIKNKAMKNQFLVSKNILKNEKNLKKYVITIRKDKIVYMYSIIN